MITEATPSEDSVALQIRSVAQAAYALEAERIGCTEFPPLRESLDDLRQSTDHFLVFRQSDRIIGVLSFDCDQDPVTITKLVVSPAQLRQGIASALLREFEQRLSPGARIFVSTAQANRPAILLYRQFGYMTAGRSNSPEGIPLLHLSKLK